MDLYGKERVNKGEIREEQQEQERREVVIRRERWKVELRGRGRKIN